MCSYESTGLCVEAHSFPTSKYQVAQWRPKMTGFGWSHTLVKCHRDCLGVSVVGINFWSTCAHPSRQCSHRKMIQEQRYRETSERINEPSILVQEDLLKSGLTYLGTRPSVNLHNLVAKQSWLKIVFPRVPSPFEAQRNWLQVVFKNG